MILSIIKEIRSDIISTRILLKRYINTLSQKANEYVENKMVIYKR